MTNQIIENARKERIKAKLEELGRYVRNDLKLLKPEESADRHYTPAHARKRCTCTKPKDWLFTVIEV